MGDITIIAGGMDEDNNLEAFGDYFYTILYMSEKLQQLGCKPPFIIKSSRYVKSDAQINNHSMFILMDYKNITIEGRSISLEEDSKVECYVNELQYILSQEYVKEWITDENLFRTYKTRYYPIIQLTDGKNIIETGLLTLFGFEKYRDDWEKVRGVFKE